MIECICINSNNKPDEIPLGKWINKGAKYHITHIYFHPGQGIQGVELKEVRLGPESAPYQSYRLSRFAIEFKDVPRIVQMMKDCKEIDDISIEELLKEELVLTD